MLQRIGNCCTGNGVRILEFGTSMEAVDVFYKGLQISTCCIKKEKKKRVTRIKKIERSTEAPHSQQYPVPASVVRPSLV